MNNNNYKLKKYTHKILNSINKNLNKNSLYWNHFSHHFSHYLNNNKFYYQMGGTNIDEIIKLFQTLDKNIIHKYKNLIETTLDLASRNELFKTKNMDLTTEKTSLQEINTHLQKINKQLELKYMCMLKSEEQIQQNYKNLQTKFDTLEHSKKYNITKFIDNLAELYKNIIKICDNKDNYLCKSYNDKSFFINLFEILKEKDENRELFNNLTK